MFEADKNPDLQLKGKEVECSVAVAACLTELSSVKIHPVNKAVAGLIECSDISDIVVQGHALGS